MSDFTSENELFIIDGQYDFHPYSDAGLGVPGALEDAKRIAKFIEKFGDKLDDIHASLDTHQQYSIFFPMFWVNKHGKQPKPNETVITLDHVKTGDWKAADSIFQQPALEYVQKLEENKRYELRIWQYHCLMGTKGWNFQDDIGNALLQWEAKFRARVDLVTKGHNMLTEHYSAVQADVQSDDPSTQMNTRLVDTLQRSRRVIVVGEARPFCVANTGRDIADYFGPEAVKQLVFFSDCMSDIPGTEALGQAFLDDMKNRGATVCTSKEFLS